MAEDRSSGRAIAARMWLFFQQAAQGQIVMGYDLSGDPLTEAVNAIDWVAAAGATRAAGEDPAPLLDRAERLDASTPTYNGAAWVALGRITLTAHLLGGCGGG
jgi:hypothetical protein